LKQVVVQLGGIVHFETMQDPVRLQSPESLLIGAEKKEVAGEKRQGRHNPAIAVANGLFDQRQVEWDLVNQQITSESFFLPWFCVKHAPLANP